MGGSVFQLRRRARIAFCGKFGGARLGRLKKSSGAMKNTFPRKKQKNRRGECMFGLHRRERIAFLSENGQAWLRHSKARPKRSKPMHFTTKKKHSQMGWAAACLDRTGVSGSCFQGNSDSPGVGAYKKESGEVENDIFAKKCRTETGENVFGLHRRERIAVLVEFCESPQISPELSRAGGRILCKGLNI